MYTTSTYVGSIGMCSAETLARRNCASILLHRQATALHTASGFKCKSCDRVFGSFQALGGHRASHNKLRLTGESASPPAVQLSFHECRECRVRFPTGQALGGHMRRHLDYLKPKPKIHKNPVLKSKPRLVLDLDLNFPPPPVEEYSFLQLVL